jgi:hypothetical protein
MTPQEYDNLPQQVKDIVDTFNEELDAYAECKRLIKELNSIGWTADYYLDGILFDIKQL